MISLRILFVCVGRGREGAVDVMCGRRWRADKGEWSCGCGAVVV